MTGLQVAGVLRSWYDCFCCWEKPGRYVLCSHLEVKNISVCARPAVSVNHVSCWSTEARPEQHFTAYERKGCENAPLSGEEGNMQFSYLIMFDFLISDDYEGK